MDKRYRSYLSIEELEKEAYILRIENIEQRINKLKQAKDIYNKAKELAELKKQVQEHSISIQAYIHGIYIASIIQSTITISKELINIGLLPRALYQAYAQYIYQINSTKTLTIYSNYIPQPYKLYTTYIVCRPSICQDLKFKTSLLYHTGEVG